MAIPVAGYVILPDDVSNAGKKMRTVSRVVGGQTVHEHYFVKSKDRNSTGYYKATSGLLTPPQTAQTLTTTAYFWFEVNAAATVAAAIHSMEISTAITNITAMITALRQQVSLFTYTGTPAGATLTAGKVDSTMASPQATIRTAVTGMTPVAGAAMFTAHLPTSLTGVGQSAPSMYVYDGVTDEDNQIVIRPGEGLCFWSPDTGVASDLRRVIANITWEEFSLS